MAALVAVLAVLAVLVTAVPLGAQPPTGQTVDGVRCDQAEGSVFHIHQHVALYVHGRAVTIPDDVGRPAIANCLYWLHTHTPDGIVHVEAPTFAAFTLGQFFDIWGQPLSRTSAGPGRVPRGALHVWVDGRRSTGDPRRIELAQHTDITLEAGPPYRKPTPFTNWGGQ